MDILTHQLFWGYKLKFGEDCSPFGRYCSKPCININSLNLQNSPMRQILLSSPFYRLGNQGSESLNILPKVIWLINDIIKIPTQANWLLGSSSQQRKMLFLNKAEPTVFTVHILSYLATLSQFYNLHFKKDKQKLRGWTIWQGHTADPCLNL